MALRILSLRFEVELHGGPGGRVSSPYGFKDFIVYTVGDQVLMLA